MTFWLRACLLSWGFNPRSCWRLRKILAVTPAPSAGLWPAVWSACAWGQCLRVGEGEQPDGQHPCRQALPPLLLPVCELSLPPPASMCLRAAGNRLCRLPSPGSTLHPCKLCSCPALRTAVCLGRRMLRAELVGPQHTTRAARPGGARSGRPGAL